MPVGLEGMSGSSGNTEWVHVCQTDDLGSCACDGKPVRTLGMWKPAAGAFLSGWTCWMLASAYRTLYRLFSLGWIGQSFPHYPWKGEMIVGHVLKKKKGKWMIRISFWKHNKIIMFMFFYKEKWENHKSNIQASCYVLLSISTLRLQYEKNHNFFHFNVF